MATSSDYHATLMLLARCVGIMAPTLYCGVSASYSITLIEPIIQHAPNQKVLAKQWFLGYQYGSRWVPPLVLPGTAANVFLALVARGTAQQVLYVAAALGVISVAPITFLYMEPGINGAAKWKVQMLCRDEGMALPDTSISRPSAHRHSATAAARRWAETADMKDLVLFWQRVNNWRWAIVGLAAGLSAYATLSAVEA